jgi:hypothetical protein
MCRIWWASNNARIWQMGSNSAFKGLKMLGNSNPATWCHIPEDLNTQQHSYGHLQCTRDFLMLTVASGGKIWPQQYGARGRSVRFVTKRHSAMTAYNSLTVWWDQLICSTNEYVCDVYHIDKECSPCNIFFDSQPHELVNIGQCFRHWLYSLFRL